MTGIELINKPNVKGFVINKPGHVIAVPVKEDGTLDWANSIRNSAVINTITCTNTRTKTDILDGNSIYKAGDRVTAITGTLAIEFSDIDLKFWGMAAGSGIKTTKNDTMLKLLEPTKIDENSFSLVLPYDYKEGGLFRIIGIDGTEYEKVEGVGGTSEVIAVGVTGTAVSADGVATLSFNDGTVQETITANVESGDDKTDVAAKLVAGNIPSAISLVYDVTLDSTSTASPKIIFKAKAAFANRVPTVSIAYDEGVTGPTASANVTTPGVAANIEAGKYTVESGSGSTIVTFSKDEAGKVVQGEFEYITETISYSQGKKTMAYHKFFIDHSWSDLANKNNYDVNIEVSQAAMGADMVDALQKDPSATKTLTFDIYAPLPGDEPYKVKINSKAIEE